MKGKKNILVKIEVKETYFSERMNANMWVKERKKLAPLVTFTRCL